MNINYEIRTVPECGKGIFALQDIKVEECVWNYKLNENVFEYNEEQSSSHLEQLATLAEQQRFLNLSFGKENSLCLITDDGQYMNHADALSSECNCRTNLKTGHCYAIRDISTGEQLFEDYLSFSHPPFLYELLKKYHCEPTYYALPAKE